MAFADPNRAMSIQGLFGGEVLRVYTSDDLVGCEIGGAAKNVIAVAAGVADGLGFGANTKAALITRGLAELTRLGVALGGNPLTFLGLAGNGDLIATCSSPLSRNRRFGEELARGRTVEDVIGATSSVAEGVDTAPALLALAGKVDIEMPISRRRSMRCSVVTSRPRTWPRCGWAAPRNQSCTVCGRNARHAGAAIRDHSNVPPVHSSTPLATTGARRDRMAEERFASAADVAVVGSDPLVVAGLVVG